MVVQPSTDYPTTEVATRPDQYTNVTQVMKRFGVTRQTVRRRINAGLLHAAVVDGHYRIDRAEAERVFAPREQYDAECLSGERLTAAEVAELIDWDELTVRREIAVNEIPSVVVEGRRLVPRAGIEHLIEAAERERQTEIEEARRLWAQIRECARRRRA